MSLQSNSVKPTEIPLSEIRRPLAPVLDLQKIDAMVATMKGIPTASKTCSLEQAEAACLSRGTAARGRAGRASQGTDAILCLRRLPPSTGIRPPGSRNAERRLPRALQGATGHSPPNPHVPGQQSRHRIMITLITLHKKHR
ncbi:CBM_collapsed_G0034980.mRNA.1.CDS.1 [Saccharomyces cerevisiae]|nr:CBM_collapsed_G0034980.mRNA.1.CDS.1 [Saccharomyces cerevisiae]